MQKLASQSLCSVSRALYLHQIRAVEPACLSLSRALKTSSGEDSHDDFKPQIKGSASKSVSEQIEEDISQSSVFIYMKGVPQAPMCGFSNMACRILDAYEVKYGFRDVLSDPELREGVKQFTSWPTIPQVFIKGNLLEAATFCTKCTKVES